MPTNSDTGQPGTELALEIVREFDAPRELLFTMFSRPEHMVKWWGPRENGEDFTTPSCNMEFMEGGRYRINIVSSSGESYWISGQYQRITKPSHLAFTFAWDPHPTQPDNEMLVTVDFEELPGERSKMSFRQSPFYDTEQRDGHTGGWSDVFDRLAIYLATKLQDTDQE
jgi:uncharacterized protein YndB with AHSA1/START domain